MIDGLGGSGSLSTSIWMSGPAVVPERFAAQFMIDGLGGSGSLSTSMTP